VQPWIAEHGAAVGDRAAHELTALVGISSPSGDVAGAEACLALCAGLLPSQADCERIPCASPGHAPDLVARLRGAGTRRVLLLGHVDTVIAHDAHRPLKDSGDGTLVGSGSVDMKGGVVLSLGVMRALAERPDDYAEVALLLVCDEEWRRVPFAHVERFSGFDACLCFEGGERSGEDDAVVVMRKGAATVRIDATGRSSHSGSAPDAGRNALLALAAAAQAVAACHAPEGEHRLTAVPTVLQAGDAFNVVPGAGRLLCDLRADDASAFQTVLDAIPAEHAGVRLEATVLRMWPGMDSRDQTRALLERASGRLGRPIVGAPRGGASDASHFAATIAVTVDGLGPRGGAAHNPEEYVVAASLHERAEVALALVDALLA